MRGVKWKLNNLLYNNIKNNNFLLKWNKINYSIHKNSKIKYSPMIEQYLNIKNKYKEYIILFQVGDFYEIFFQDAIRISNLLGIVLTKKIAGNIKNKDIQLKNSIPMCGFPCHTLSTYVNRLVKQNGLMIAICNQTHNVKDRKKNNQINTSDVNLIDRKVVRLITPGTLLDENVLNESINNYIASIYIEINNQNNNFSGGISWMDISTGEFFTSYFENIDILKSDLIKCLPSEIILPKFNILTPENSKISHIFTSLRYLFKRNNSLDGNIANENSNETYTKDFNINNSNEYSNVTIHYRPENTFSVDNGKNKLDDIKKNNIYTLNHSAISNVEYASISALLEYIEFTQKEVFPFISSIEKKNNSDTMMIDASAWKALEIVKSNHSGVYGSLFHSINKTSTNLGARLLMKHLSNPSMNIKIIEDRLDGIKFFLQNPHLLSKIRQRFKFNTGNSNNLEDTEKYYNWPGGDPERSLQRVSVNKSSPKDIRDIAESILFIFDFYDDILEESTTNITLPFSLAEYKKILKSNRELIRIMENITRAIRDDAYLYNLKAGNFIKPGYSHTLDEYRNDLNYNYEDTNGKSLLSSLRKKSGCEKLRIKDQPKIGLFVEIPVLQRDKITNNSNNDFTYFHSTKTHLKYRCPELDIINNRIYHAQEEINKLENEIFSRLNEDILNHISAIRKIYDAISHIDVMVSHSCLARDRNYVRPVVDMSTDIEIKDGIHTVVESYHLKGGKNTKNSVTSKEKDPNRSRFFIPNDCFLYNQKSVSNTLLSSNKSHTCLLITGPNMGGKSTFLRQNAHIVLLAQMGSYVPAHFARIGLVDKLFCRVGSTDDLASDKSTFMMEMEETATILNQATKRSLAIMDEVGRGTSIEDGVGVATAVLEYLCENRIRTLFATHFHIVAELLKEQIDKESIRCYKLESFLHTNKETNDTPAIIYTHKILPGVAKESHGLHVALSSGCPVSVVNRAKYFIEKLNKYSNKGSKKYDLRDYIKREIFGKDLNTVSPKEALDKLYLLEEWINNDDKNRNLKVK